MKRSIIAIGSCFLLLFAFCTAGFGGYEGKKVLFIDSYHEGYAWSDKILKGVQEGFKGKGIELKVVRMDTKRNGSDEAKKAAGVKAKEEIESFKPDLVIAADDNASQHVIAPFYKNVALPVVFCGVNWDASGYGFPCSNVTGMLEVTEVDALNKLFKGIAKGGRIGFIADDNETNRKEVENYKKHYNMDLVTVYAKTFDEFKKGYVEIQGKVDSLIVYNYAGLKGWNAAEAEEFIVGNTRIPTGTFQEEVMPFAMIGYLKLPEEQGQWSAAAALKIFDGAKPADIAISKNKEGMLMLNAKIAEKAGITLPYELIQSAAKVIQ